MKLGLSNWSRTSLYAGVAALALGIAALPSVDAFAQGKGKEAGATEKGHTGQGGAGGHGSGSKRDVTRTLTDDDSDRSEWSQGNRDSNPHAKGGGQPSGAGDTKGDLYGDLVLILRDPVTGLPDYDDNGELQICTSADCSTYVSTVEGEIPEGTTTFEVDFGRASIARSPDAVVSKALTDALDKLESADAGTISTDEAGRITFEVDGVSATIDSPLENLALYIELMDSLANDTDSEGLVAVLGDLATLNTAASLLAGVADKTGDIGLDYVYYENRIVDLDYVEAGDDAYYDYSDFTYDRSYDTAYPYVVVVDGAYVDKTLDINEYLDAINGTLPSATEKAALFAAAADDALEVIELLHTQLFIEVLPGTN